MKRVANRLALIATLLLATAHAQQPRLQITSPANNSVVAEGQATTITVSADSSVQIVGVITESPLPEVRATSSPSQFLLVVSGSVPPGVYNLTAIGISSKHAVNSNPVAIRVERSTSPVGIDVGPATLYLHSVGDQFPLEVKGLFADGTSADISHSSRVLYTSNDPRVVTVSSDGMVTAIGAGKTTILVRAGVTSSYTYAAAKVEVPEQPSTAAPPIIISVDPKSGIPGLTRVTVEGSGFGSTQGEGFIQVGDRNGQVLSWSDTKIVATVDPWARPAVVSVNQNRMNSNNIPFGISAPVIQGMTPIALEAGKQATIRGSGFGSTQGNGYVQTANTRATIVDWGDTRIVITVPPGTTNGHLYVHQSGVDSHPINLYMAAQ